MDSNASFVKSIRRTQVFQQEVFDYKSEKGTNISTLLIYPTIGESSPDLVGPPYPRYGFPACL